MNLISGQDVDIINPFPASMLGQAAQWMHCYKTLIFGDDGPRTTQEIENFLKERASHSYVASWGVVDKNNLTQSKEFEAPLVGIIFFEHVSPTNGYAHLASNRRAWGEKLAKPGLMDQAGELAIQEVWKHLPTVQRISLTAYANNKAAWNMARRLGFKKDGFFKDMGKLKGQPQDVVHFGRLRDIKEL